MGQLQIVPPPSEDRQDDRNEGDNDGHNPNIDDLQGRIQALNIFAQSMLNIAQLLANAQHFAAELVECFLLAGGQNNLGPGFIADFQTAQFFAAQSFSGFPGLILYSGPSIPVLSTNTKSPPFFQMVLQTFRSPAIQG